MARQADSLGVNLGGKPELVTIEFQPEAAPYVAEREYHASQSLETRADGCLVLKMRVAVDFALSAWVLSFGPRARVVGPRRLAQVILEQVEDMRANYAPRSARAGARRSPATSTEGTAVQPESPLICASSAATARSSIVRCAG